MSAGKRVAGKGSTLSSSSIFLIANGFARVSIDSAALSRRPSSKFVSAFPFSIPNYFTAEEIRASLLVLLNKLLLSSSSTAAAQLLEILEQDASSWDYTLSDVASDDLCSADYSFAAIDGVSAVLDHCTSALSSISDAVAAISCEALRADASPFNLIDSRDGSSPKDAIAVAVDFKLFFNGSKLVNSGKKLLEPSVAEIPSIHGSLREVSRLLHSKARVLLNSGFRASSAKDISTALSSLVISLSNLGEASFHRVELLVANSVSDDALRSRLSEMLNAKCPRTDSLEELGVSLQNALRKKDYLFFLHSIYQLLLVVWKIVSWEAIAAFISLDGEIFVHKIQENIGSGDEPPAGDSARADKKNGKKKKGSFG